MFMGYSVTFLSMYTFTSGKENRVFYKKGLTVPKRVRVPS